MKKTFVLMAVFAGFATLLPSCKKYEEGPGFSLLTKKARLTGNWSMSSFREESSTTSGDPSSTFTTVTQSNNGSDLTETKTSTSGTNTVRTGRVSQAMTIDKKGNYIIKKTTVLTSVETNTIGTTTTETTKEETVDSQVKGTWNFSGGVGEAKKKENLILSTTGNTVTTTNRQTVTVTSASGSSSSTSTNTTTVTDAYSGYPQLLEMEIVLLKNKELKLRYNSSTSSSTMTGSSTINGSQVDKYIVNYKQ